MPSGFIGNAARSYITATSDALSAAASANTHGNSKGQSPVRVSEANRGSFRTGVGNSSNIVVDSQTYNEALRMMDRIDDRMGELFYNISRELEDMCETSYVVPQTAPRFLHVCDSVKNSMSKFRSLTGDIEVCTNRFVSDITSIG